MKIKQTFILTSVVAITSLLLGVIIGLVIGIKVNSKQNNKVEKITSTTVLTRINDQAFLVSKSIISDQTVQIKVDQGSSWSNFWWGHEITAEAYIQVDLGTDFSKITESDIQIDDQNKTIKIKLPESQVYNSSLKSDIQVSTKSGILKKLFASDTNQDYNLALSELTKQAESAVKQDNDLLKDAKNASLNTLQAIFKDTGYTISVK
jgi:hypothetical protein